MYSKVNWLYIYLLFFRFFSHIGHYRALSRVLLGGLVVKTAFSLRGGMGLIPAWGSKMVLVVKNRLQKQETWVWSLGREDPLKEGMATHSSILAWRIPWTEEPGGLYSIGLQRVGHDWNDLACAWGTKISHAVTLKKKTSLSLMFVFSLWLEQV